MGKSNINIPYTSEFIIGSLSNKAKIEEGLLYAGGIDQLNLLIDLELLLEEANLTERQMQVVDLYYCKQYTQEEVSRRLGVSQQAVLDHIKKIKSKIQKVINIWGAKDESYNR